jgi:hypothetical protein
MLTKSDTETGKMGRRCNKRSFRLTWIRGLRNGKKLTRFHLETAIQKNGTSPLIQRKAYGFHSFENCRLLVIAHCGYLP